MHIKHNSSKRSNNAHRFGVFSVDYFPQAKEWQHYLAKVVDEGLLNIICNAEAASVIISIPPKSNVPPPP